MTSFEEIMRSRGLSYGDTEARAGTSGCSYNPNEADDAALDCGQIARWHIRLISEVYTDGQTIAACDVHLGVAEIVFGGVILDRHEWGEACNLPGSWWFEPEGCGSLCVTPERGIQLGVPDPTRTGDPGTSSNL